MAGESMLPNYAGVNEGDYGYSLDGSVWRWQINARSPRTFSLTAEHANPYSPVTSGLTAEEMAPLIFGFMKDPNCKSLSIMPMPRNGEWILETPAPEPIETEESALIADAGHVAISN